MPNADFRLTPLLPPQPLLLLFVRALLLIFPDALVGATDEGGGLPPSLPGDNGYNDTTTGIFLESPVLTEETRFALRVLVKDMVTRRFLPGATVGIYMNHTLNSSTWTGQKGEALLWVPYSPGQSMTLVATLEGYIPSPLPWSTTKRPIFSAVTLLLLPQRQGNIWLFEDSLLITAKLPDSASQPKIKIPMNLLTLPDNSNVSLLTAYLTVPPLAKDCVNCTPGIIVNMSVFRTVGLKPLAAVSVQLYVGGKELQIRGPIQFSIPLGRSNHLRVSDTVPAWAFNLQTGGWENQGLGIVTTVGEELVWTYTASHLGYWIAAPLPSYDHGSSLDFLSHHTLLLVGILAGTLVVVIGFLSLLICQCRSHREPKGRRARFSKLTVVKKDQTTSMHMEEGLLFHSGENILASCNVQSDPLSTPRHKANYNIYVEDPSSQATASLYDNMSTDCIKVPQVHSHYINNEEVSRFMEQMDLNRSNMNSDSFFPDKLVHIYNHPVAIIQAPDIYSNQEPQKAGCKSATFPRNGNEFDSHSDVPSKDNYPQKFGKVQNSQQQSNPDEPQPLETPPPSQGPPAVWGRYSNLLESSVSVPGTLNEAAGMEAFSGCHGISGELQGISERTLLELTRGKSSSSHPRAWFVSLDGKPAAQVRHSIIELQSRHRPTSSNDTSLDSGVDMNEPQQNIREVQRERMSIRASSLPHQGRSGRYGDEQDLSSSESGTTATGTPEDHSLRSILDGSSGTIPNIPEEQDGMDTSSNQEENELRGTPPPRRLKKAKVKSEKRNTKHVREGRPLTKRR
ncbi:family with sequence similarity 171 member B isoform X1 [Corythoichthys intestinalis]|uniref:family with sequence similarity 171 member B isoform X1 n=1 Tax=Corythoichthys intestinalis TaxID=161448 RepID=UPI0025A641A2|nr:protein FAM171B isoform X1 [Corythoichthys intestinalis]